MEQWKFIEGYDNRYEISNFGRLRSRVGNIKILTFQKTSKGYIRYCLTKDHIQKKFAAHRLVAQAFMPNSDKLAEVHHINGNRSDNNVENLEWVSKESNMKRRLFSEHDRKDVKYNLISYLTTISERLSIKTIAELVDYLTFNLQD